MADQISGAQAQGQSAFCYTMLCDDATGIGFASGQHSQEPTLGAHEVACTKAQATDPRGWKLVGSSLVATTPADLAPTPAQLVAYAAAKQIALAAGGLTVNVAAAGAPPEPALVDTDLTGRLNLSGLVQLASLDSAFTTIWVQSSGVLTLDATQIVALGVAVGRFVEGTYRALAAVLAAITAGTITTTAAVDAAAWPATAV